MRPFIYHILFIMCTDSCGIIDRASSSAGDYNRSLPFWNDWDLFCRIKSRRFLRSRSDGLDPRPEFQHSGPTSLCQKETLRRILYDQTKLSRSSMFSRVLWRKTACSRFPMHSSCPICLTSATGPLILMCRTVCQPPVEWRRRSERQLLYFVQCFILFKVLREPPRRVLW